MTTAISCNNDQYSWLLLLHAQRYFIHGQFPLHSSEWDLYGGPEAQNTTIFEKPHLKKQTKRIFTKNNDISDYRFSLPPEKVLWWQGRIRLTWYKFAPQPFSFDITRKVGSSDFAILCSRFQSHKCKNLTDCYQFSALWPSTMESENQDWHRAIVPGKTLTSC